MRSVGWSARSRARRALEAHRLAVTLFDRLSIAEPDNADYRSYLTRNLLYCASLERPTSPARATASLDRARLVLDQFSREEPMLRYDLAAEYARLIGPTTGSPTADSDGNPAVCASPRPRRTPAPDRGRLPRSPANRERSGLRRPPRASAVPVPDAGPRLPLQPLRTLSKGARSGRVRER